MAVEIQIHKPHIQKHQKQKEASHRIARDPFEHVPEDYKKMARGLEQQFAEYMVKQMTTSIGRGQEDSAMDYYQDLNQKEQARMMTEVNNGLGLQKLILDEIYPERFRNKEAMQAYNQQKEKSQIKRNTIEMMGPPSELKPEINKKEKAKIKLGREASHE
jgi:Rod binding domain-containing protein